MYHSKPRPHTDTSACEGGERNYRESCEDVTLHLHYNTIMYFTNCPDDTGDWERATEGFEEGIHFDFWITRSYLSYKSLCSISMCSGGSYGSLICSRIVISLDSCASAIHQQHEVLKHVIADSLSLVIPYFLIRASRSDAWSAAAPSNILSLAYSPSWPGIDAKDADMIPSIKYPKQFQFWQYIELGSKSSLRVFSSKTIHGQRKAFTLSKRLNFITRPLWSVCSDLQQSKRPVWKSFIFTYFLNYDELLRSHPISSANWVILSLSHSHST